MKNTENKMTDFMEKEYAKSIDFWNEWFGQKEETPEEFDKETAWKEIGSKELADAAASLATQSNVLDYGCGSGWAPVIMVKSGCPHVTAVDLSENGIEASIEYAKTFGVDNQIDFYAISQDWLENHEDNFFDGLFCSNVLDVVPSVVCKEILKGAAHVCKKGAKVIVGLNPCFEKDYIEKRGFKEQEKDHLFYEGILRIVNHTDEEWTQILSKYFKVIECRHFRWDGEPDTVNRRIFFLEKQ